eukprot:7266548-Pyramimonas_sp.AAC.1
MCVTAKRRAKTTCVVQYIAPKVVSTRRLATLINKPEIGEARSTPKRPAAQFRFSVELRSRCRGARNGRLRRSPGAGPAGGGGAAVPRGPGGSAGPAGRGAPADALRAAQPGGAAGGDGPDGGGGAALHFGGGGQAGAAGGGPPKYALLAEQPGLSPLGGGQAGGGGAALQGGGGGLASNARVHARRHPRGALQPGQLAQGPRGTSDLSAGHAPLECAAKSVFRVPSETARARIGSPFDVDFASGAFDVDFAHGAFNVDFAS